MNRFALAGAALSLVLLAVAGCPDIVPNETDGIESPPSAAALFSLITVADPYEEWERFPGLDGIIESAAPHGPMARVFINAQVTGALTNFTGLLPDGSIIVKENIGESSTGKADALTIMWKVQGFDPDNNDWFWANVTPEGAVNAEGMIEGCVNCHARVRANDFVFLHEF